MLVYTCHDLYVDYKCPALRNKNMNVGHGMDDVGTDYWNKYPAFLQT